MSREFLLVLLALFGGAGVYYYQAVEAIALAETQRGCGGGCGSAAMARVAAARGSGGCGVSAGGGCGACAKDKACGGCGAKPADAATGAVRGAETVRLGEGDLLLGVPGEGPLTLAEIEAWLDDSRNHRELTPVLPVGLDEGIADTRGLAENPLTRAKIELGRQLYFDPRLSGDGTISCASCHDPAAGYAASVRFSPGIDGQLGVRNSPTIVNRILSNAQFWDGRAASLEEQAIGPMANPAEMGFSHEAVVDLVQDVEGYRVQFERVFAEGVTIEDAGRAIAAFERAVVTGPSPWDRRKRLELFQRANAEELVEIIAADSRTLTADETELIAEQDALIRAASEAPLSQAAARGAELFFGDRTGCTQCHAGANFADERYHNLGVGLAAAADWPEGEPLPESIDDAIEGAIDWGRFTVTGDESDRGRFKTPTLRNVAQTAPYMHDGSQESLADVVAWYVQGGGPNPWLSPLLEPLDLDEREQADLVAFLESLTGALPPIETGRLPE